MFYPRLNQKEAASSGEVVSAIVSLTVAESKRLIAKGVAALPEVRRAMQNGRIVIARGSTNAYVAEELLGTPIEAKANYAAGLIAEGRLGINGRRQMMEPYVLRDGKPVPTGITEILKEFRASDVFIKGANAIDLEGYAGVLLGGEEAGTIGAALPTVTARGSHLIVPAGLEKLIPSVIEAAGKCGVNRYKYGTGTKVGFMPVVTGKIVTEIQALEVLTGVSACHISSGGIAGSEGGVVLVLEGNEDEVERAWQLVSSIKGEAPVAKPLPAVKVEA